MERYTRHRFLAFLLMGPQVLVILVFFIWPAARAVLQSFFYSDAFGLQQHFAGLGNFKDILSSPDYGNAVLVTAIMAIAISFLTMSFGLILALIVQGTGRMKPVYKSLLLWPYAIAPAVAAILWRFLCHPTLGWLSSVLKSFGVDFNYHIYPHQALWVVILTASWQQLSYNFLFLFAALQLIPKNLLEAATLDGASAWYRFWQIIFPLLSPTLFFLISMNMIYSFFDTFGIVHVLTHGGPGNTTTSLVYKVYQDGFVAMDPGSSSAQSVLLMLLVTVLSLVQFRFLEKKVHYQ